MILISLILSLLASEPEVPVIGLEDLERRLSNGKDTTYVVNFWATWCKPCIEELPAFDKLSRRSAGTTVKVVLVSLDAPEDLEKKVIPFMTKKGLTAEVVLLDEPKPNSWIDKIDESWSGAIPATMLFAGSSGRRQFFERDFTFDELTVAVQGFRNVSR